MTVTTSGTSYCSGAVFLNFYDARLIGDLLQDDGTRDSSPATNTNLAKLLLAASGAVESACLPGGRYTPTDLASLTGAGLALLQQTVAAIALQMALEHKAQPGVPEMPGYVRAMELLDRLRKGERCFGFIEVQEAGQMAGTADTLQQRIESNGVVFQASEYFGSRTWTRR